MRRPISWLRVFRVFSGFRSRTPLNAYERRRTSILVILIHSLPLLPSLRNPSPSRPVKVSQGWSRFPGIFSSLPPLLPLWRTLKNTQERQFRKSNLHSSFRHPHCKIAPPPHHSRNHRQQPRIAANWRKLPRIPCAHPSVNKSFPFVTTEQILSHYRGEPEDLHSTDPCSLRIDRSQRNSR